MNELKPITVRELTQLTGKNANVIRGILRRNSITSIGRKTNREAPQLFDYHATLAVLNVEKNLNQQRQEIYTQGLTDIHDPIFKSIAEIKRIAAMSEIEKRLSDAHSQ